MEIGAYQLIEHLDAGRKTGLIEFYVDNGEIYVEAKDAQYEAINEQTLKVSGMAGYGTIATCDSTVFIDIEEIKYIRHTTKEMP